MGFAWNGVCYQDTASALDAFARDVPAVDAAGINTFNTTPTISASGLISWSIVNRPLTGSSATTRTGSTQLPACSNPDFGQWSQQSIELYLALFFAAFLGFKTGFRP